MHYNEEVLTNTRHYKLKNEWKSYKFSGWEWISSFAIIRLGQQKDRPFLTCS